jgi:hypothetical protein
LLGQEVHSSGIGTCPPPEERRRYSVSGRFSIIRVNAPMHPGRARRVRTATQESER